MKNRLHIILAVVGIVFGLMTLKTGGLTLFTEEGRVAAGDYVPFVLWFNFLAGFFYILASVGILLGHSPARTIAKILALASLGVFILLLGHVALGGSYEVKTIVAMIVRGGFWAMVWMVLPHLDKRLSRLSS